MDEGAGGKSRRVGAVRTQDGIEIEIEDEDIDVTTAMEAVDSEELDPLCDLQTRNEAIWREINTLEEYEVFAIVKADQARGKKFITPKWVFTNKYYGWKARLCARDLKAFTWWLRGLFAASSQPSSGRIIDFIGLKRRWLPFEIDAESAYLNVPETEECYMRPPKEWIDNEERQKRDTDVVWKLLKMLYGRRTAGQAWVEWFSEKLILIGALRCPEAPQFFFLPRWQIAMEVHMDDVHGVGVDPRNIHDMADALKGYLKIKFEGPFFPGMRYSHLGRVRILYEDGVFIKADEKHLDKAIAILALEKARPAATPASAEDAQDEEDSPALNADEAKDFHSCVGTLLYYGLDKEDIQREVSVAGRDLSAPTAQSVRRLKRLVRYLIGVRDEGVFLPRPEEGNAVVVRGFSDSDWASDKATRKSISSLHVEADECALFGRRARQSVISWSSGESEFLASASAGSETVLISAILRFFQFDVVVKLMLDSEAAMGIIQREGVGKIRHLSVRCLWMQAAMRKKWFELEKVHTDRNKADLGTKILAAARFRVLKKLSGIFALGELGEDKVSRFQQVSQEMVASCSQDESVLVHQISELLVAALRASRSSSLR